jgi:myo-inositol 2-dehydrogenase/D-chiro-inositol 1-dehydrogenase
MSRIRVAVIGCGHVAQQHVRAWKLYPREVEVVALCDRVRAKAEETRAKNKLPDARVLTDYRELVEAADVDAVDVCTYSDLHDDILAAFMPAGKHVATEKPVGYSLENCRRLRYFAGHFPKVKVQVAYSLRYYPINIKVKRLIAEGAIGQPLHAEITHMHPHDLKGRKADWVASRAHSGIEGTADSGGRYIASSEMIHSTHAFDLARYILSDEPFDVFSFQHTAAAFALIRFVKGALATVTSGASTTRGIPNVTPVLVQGTEGTIYTSWDHFDHPKNAVLTGYLVSNGKRRVIRAPQDTGHGDRVRVRNFIDALKKNAPLICDIEDGIRTSELLHALWDSQSHEIRVPIHRRTQTG